MVALVALLHVLIHTGEALFVLSHALGQVVLNLLLLLKHRVIVDLFNSFPFFFHLLLNVNDQAILVPDTVLRLCLDQSIPFLITPNSAKDGLYLGFFYPISRFLNDFKCLNKIFIFLESTHHFLFGLFLHIACSLILLIN